MTKELPSQAGMDPSISSPGMTILRTADGRSIGKRFQRKADGWHRTKPAHRSFLAEPVRISPRLFELSTVLQDVSGDTSACLIRDTPSEPSTLPLQPIRRKGEHFQVRRSPFIPLDFDGVPLDELEGVDLTGWSPGEDPARDVDVINAIRRRYLPVELQRAPAIAVWSASTGFRKQAGSKTYRPDRHLKTVGFHLWFLADRAVPADHLRDWCRLQAEQGAPIDPALYHRVQPIYCGPPEIVGELPPDAPPLLTAPRLRMVRLPAQGCKNCYLGWWNDHRDTVSASIFHPPSPARRPPPQRRKH